VEVNRILRIVGNAGLYRNATFPQAPYRVTAGDKADIIVTIVESVALPESVSITVRDADTNEQLFHEQRELVELSNDIKRLVKHFLTTVEEKKVEAERAEEAALRQQRDAQLAAEAARLNQQCRDEEDALRKNIISVVIVQHGSVPLTSQNITDHNQRCPDNLVVPDDVVNYYKAEVAAQQAAEHARLEQVRQEQEKKKVLSAWHKEIAAAPFVIPVAGRMKVSYQLPVSGGLYYIIPSEGKPDKCTLPAPEPRKLKKAKAAIYVGVLDCLRTGRADFLVVTANDHYYLVQAIKVLGAMEQVGMVKDNGTTICFHEDGCQHVLAEVRLAPSDLPRGVQVPPPAPLTASYDQEGLSFRYPGNWEVSNRNGGTLITIAPDAGRIGTWFAVGMFVMHRSSNASFPTTAAATLEKSIAYYQKVGRVFQAQTTPVKVAGLAGVMANYSTSSPISGEEKGQLVVVPDGGHGYYEFWAFSPGNESGTYRAVLDSILV